jgi:hypothetical protein
LRLRQICLNLLSNAITFTDVGQVVLAARCNDEGLVIEVSDTGQGRGGTFRVHLRLHVLELSDPPLAAPPPQRVAVVSDEPAAQEALRDRLLHLNHECMAVIAWRESAFAPESLESLQRHAVLYDEPPAGGHQT